MKKKTTTDDLLAEAIGILKNLKMDAQMALTGDWDANPSAPVEDNGFVCQINHINKFLRKCRYHKSI